MTWIASHTEIGTHPKTYKLMDLLKINRAEAVGLIHLLWHFTVMFSWKNGDLERFGMPAIARGSGFEGDVETYIRALQESGLLDGFVVHDWVKLQGPLIAQRRYNERRQNGVRTASERRQSGVKTPLQRESTKKERESTENHFALAYKIYLNHKGGKIAAFNAWSKAEKNHQKEHPERDFLKTCLEAIEKQNKSPEWLKNDGQYIPHFSTWLNQGRWEDEVQNDDHGTRKFHPSDLI